MAAYDPDANIVAQLGELNLSQDLLFPDVVVLSEQVDDLSIEIALQWTSGVAEQICSYANGSPTTQGGMHVEGFSKALTEVVGASPALEERGGRTHMGRTALLSSSPAAFVYSEGHDDRSDEASEALVGWPLVVPAIQLWKDDIGSREWIQPGGSGRGPYSAVSA